MLAGILFALGLMVFCMNTAPAMDMREGAMEARGSLLPLQAAPTKPIGGGMANLSYLQHDANGTPARSF